MAKMREELDVDDLLSKGRMDIINKWLKDNIHQYQNNIAPREIFLKTCKKDFDPNYYIEYLCDKYTKLYELENVA